MCHNEAIRSGILEHSGGCGGLRLDFLRSVHKEAVHSGVFERDPEMNMAQKITHGSSAKHMLSEFDRRTHLGLGTTEMCKFRVRQES